MAKDYETSSAQAFRLHYDQIVDMIQEPDLPILGARFFSREFISKETMEMVGNMTTPKSVRASKLMLYVMAYLDVHPEKFQNALDVFKSEQVYARLYTDVSSSHGQISQDANLAESSPMTPQTPPTTAVGKYAEYLRKVYLRSKVPVKGKWPPSPCKKIIKLAAIEKESVNLHSRATNFARANSIDEYLQNNSMSPISLDDLFLTKDGSPPKTVVVQGVPGIGKSTFAWKFCRKWAKGKINQQYDLVVLLRMRDTRVREAKTLSDLFSAVHPNDQELTEGAMKEVVSCRGKGVVIVLEGLDELPSSLLGDDTLFLELLQGILLPEVTIVVTSRPWAVQTLVEKCEDQLSRRVEILGFTKDDILRYVSNAFCEEEKKEFLEYLYSHPQLESIMHIPLNAAFVVHIYKQYKHSQQAIPRTLTQLYSALVQGVLLRYMKSVPELSDFKLVNLQTLPEPIKSHFEQLCVLSFMGFTKLTVQVTFTDSEAALYGCLDSLGLMQSSADICINTGTTVTHSFLHFTIQEFLAAYHLSLQPSDVQNLFFQTHCRDLQFSVLLGFLIGLNSKVVRNIAISDNQSIESRYLCWFHESQSPKDVLECLGTDLLTYESSFGSTPFDLYALTYCMCHSKCQWDLCINMKELTSVYSEEPSDIFGEIVQLSATEPTQTGIHHFFSLPEHLFSNLSVLCLHGIDGSTDLAIAKVIQTKLIPRLKQISIRYQDTTVYNIGVIMEALRMACPSINYIFIGVGKFTSSEMIPLCKYISSSTSLSTLVLWNNMFLENSLQMLISAIGCAKTLTHLCLFDNEVSTSDIEMLSFALSTNCTLRILKLQLCSIDGEGAEYLATGLEDNHVLEKLSLSGNNIDTRGASALSQMLRENTSLKSLFLMGNNLIGAEGAIKLMNALENNATLHNLMLPSDCKPIEYETVLMKSVRVSGRVIFS